MGKNDILFPGIHNERLKSKAKGRALASTDDLGRLASRTQDIATHTGLAIDAMQSEILSRQQEIAQWGVEHLVLLRVLVRRGVITEDDLRAEREAVRAEVEAAQSDLGEEPSPANET